MNPASDQYGHKITTVHVVAHKPPPSGGSALPNTGLALWPFLILVIALMLVGLILRTRSN